MATDVKLLLKVLSSNMEIPEHEEIRVLVNHNNNNTRTDDGRIVLHNNPLTLSEYAEEYESLKKQGVKWINLQCAGLMGSVLVIVIEYSSSTRVETHGATSIKFTGPFKNDNGIEEWDFEKSYALA